MELVDMGAAPAAAAVVVVVAAVHSWVGLVGQWGQAVALGVGVVGVLMQMVEGMASRLGLPQHGSSFGGTSWSGSAVVAVAVAVAVAVGMVGVEAWALAQEWG